MENLFPSYCNQKPGILNGYISIKEFDNVLEELTKRRAPGVKKLTAEMIQNTEAKGNEKISGIIYQNFDDDRLVPERLADNTENTRDTEKTITIMQA